MKMGIDVRCATNAAGLFAVTTLSGCASFSGLPDPVISAKSIVDVAETGPYAIEVAAKNIETPPANAREFRNAFIAIQLAAIDARYYEFRRKLSAQSKGANFGLELGVLGLTGAGSVVSTPLANILSAGGAGLTGTKAALSKEVYFERALPALLATIDAHRLEARAPLIEGIRKDVVAYPLVQAIADLFAYQNSASLDGAIGRITQVAVEEKAAAEEKYENVVATCAPENGVGADWAKIRAGLNALDPAKDEPKLDLVSDIVGTDATLPFVEQRSLVIRKLAGSYCSRAAAQALIARLTADAGVVFP